MAKISEEKKFVELFMDTDHWIHLTEIAQEKRITIDQLLGAMIEYFLVNTGKLAPDTECTKPMQVLVQLEPIRSDEEYFQNKLAARAITKDQKDMLSQFNTTDISEFEDWGKL